jgi:hypothetical protein
MFKTVVSLLPGHTSYLEVMGKKREHLRSKYVVGVQAVINPRTFPSACHYNFSVAAESVRQITTAT